MALAPAALSAQNVTALSGSGQRAVAGNPFPQPFIALVTDGSGNPVSGVSISFTGPGLDTTHNTTATSDASGRAGLTLYANSTAQAYTVAASVSQNWQQMASFSARQGNFAACQPNLTVTSLADSGSGTLREAVNEICDAGTIDMSALAGTITLASRIYLGGNVTLNGPAGGALTISGNGSTRVLFVQDGNVTLQNLVLANGYARGGNGSNGGAGAGMGGAIFQNGGSLTLTNVSIGGSVAQGGSYVPFLGGGGGGFGGNGQAQNGAGGGDLGGLSGPSSDGIDGELNGGDGAGGSDASYYCVPCQQGGQGGFGAGGGAGLSHDGNGGFGGAGSHGSASIYGVGGWAAGNSGSLGSGGGAGLGGGIFVRRGLLNLSGVAFNANQALGGTGESTVTNESPNGGDGKGGALFILLGAYVNASGVTYLNSVASQAGQPTGFGGSYVPYVSGSKCPGSDTADVCGQATPGNLLTVTVSGPGAVSSGTTGFNTIQCPGLCSMAGNSSVTLTATPASGYGFAGWSGACTGTGTCTVSLAAAGQTVAAAFLPMPAISTSAVSETMTYNPAGSTGDQITATVTGSGGVPVNDGTVTFTIGNLTVPVTVGVANGTAVATVTIPAGAHVGSYTVNAGYSGGTAFAPASTSAEPFRITQAQPVLTWQNPAPIVYGTALSSEQLKAASNVPGTFNYSPVSGTVLPAGASQKLSVSFTPTDSTDYSSASTSATITVNPAPAAGPVNLVISNTLKRFTFGGVGYTYIYITIANTGGTDAQNVTIASVKLAGVIPIDGPSQAVGTIPAGTSLQVSFTEESSSLPVSGSPSSLSITGTYTGGTFSSNSRVTLP